MSKEQPQNDWRERLERSESKRIRGLQGTAQLRSILEKVTLSGDGKCLQSLFEELDEMEKALGW